MKIKKEKGGEPTTKEIKKKRKKENKERNKYIMFVPIALLPGGRMGGSTLRAKSDCPTCSARLG